MLPGMSTKDVAPLVFHESVVLLPAVTCVGTALRSVIETVFSAPGPVGDGDVDGAAEGAVEGAGVGDELTLCVLGLEGLTAEKVSVLELISQPDPMTVVIAATARDLFLSPCGSFILVAPKQVSELKLLRYERWEVPINID